MPGTAEQVTGRLLKRTARQNALLCVIGYGKLEISEEIDKVIVNFYDNVIGEYWDKERKYVASQPNQFISLYYYE